MKNKLMAGLVLGLFPAALFAQGFNVTPRQQTLLSEIPTTNSEASHKIFKELGQDIPKLVPELASKLSTQKGDTDTTARFALGGLVWNVGYNGTSAQKKALARSIADNIAKAQDTEPKDFLIEQLQYLGDPSIKDVLYPLMTDKTVGPRVIRTITALNPPDLAQQALSKLNDSNTTEVQTGLLLTIARIAPKDAAAKIAPLANSDDRYIRDAALDALAAIGDPASREALKQAAAADKTLDDQLAPARYLAYAENVAKRGNKKLAAEIAREIANEEHTTATLHLEGLALSTLADIAGEGAIEDLFNHVNDDAEDIRAIALQNLNRFKSKAVTDRLANDLKNPADTEVAVAVLDALGDRGDASAMKAVNAQVSDSDAAIAVAAVNAGGALDRSKALPAYLEALKKPVDKAVLEAVVNQLKRVKSAELLPAIAKQLPSTTPEAQVALVGLLGERRAGQQKEAVFAAAKSDNAKVRAAAYDALGQVAEAGDLPRLRDMILAADSNAERKSARKAFVTAAQASGDTSSDAKLLTEKLESAPPEGQAALLETLSALGDAGSIAQVQKIAESNANPEVQDAAVRALADWQGKDVLPALEQIASKSKNEKHQVLAVRGIARLAETEKDADARVDLLARAAKLAKRGEELKTVIAQLADIKTTASLKALSPYLDNKAVAAEASAAAVKIAMPDEKDPKAKPGIVGAEAIDILSRALNTMDDKARKPVEKHIYELIRQVEAIKQPVDSEGFTELFNGNDLTGWTGDTHSYTVKDGVIDFARGSHGNLFTEKQYGDFVLRFEFKLEKAGNNGVGIRAPLTGDIAYTGMEIQILDQNDPKYKDLKEWQRHGSVYGVAAAKPATVKVGEWNQEEIVVNGRNIKVTLNGEVINDVNLDEATKNGFISNRDHPGVKRNRGHIGFLGHTDPIQLRNIRVKNIANDAPPEGFTSIYNGKDLQGWKGLVANPIKRREMTPDQLKAAQKKADKALHQHWDIDGGILFFDGLGSHACTTKDYKDFEMYVDWCIPPGGDNGIYLRGSPQVQIWDPHYWPQGSGGLYNNQKATSDPLVLADNPIGQWNTFYIKMVGDKVTVDLNGKRVVENEVLENYWDRKQPIFDIDQIELQSHGSPAWWRNIYIKELP